MEILFIVLYVVIGFVFSSYIFYINDTDIGDESVSAEAVFIALVLFWPFCIVWKLIIDYIALMRRFKTKTKDE